MLLTHEAPMASRLTKACHNELSRPLSLRLRVLQQPLRSSIRLLILLEKQFMQSLVIILYDFFNDPFCVFIFTYGTKDDQKSQNGGEHDCFFLVPIIAWDCSHLRTVPAYNEACLRGFITMREN